MQIIPEKTVTLEEEYSWAYGEIKCCTNKEVKSHMHLFLGHYNECFFLIPLQRVEDAGRQLQYYIYIRVYVFFLIYVFDFMHKPEMKILDHLGGR